LELVKHTQKTLLSRYKRNRCFCRKFITCGWFASSVL